MNLQFSWHNESQLVNKWLHIEQCVSQFFDLEMPKAFGYCYMYMITSWKNLWVWTWCPLRCWRASHKPLLLSSPAQAVPKSRVIPCRATTIPNAMVRHSRPSRSTRVTVTSAVVNPKCRNIYSWTHTRKHLSSNPDHGGLSMQMKASHANYRIA